MLARENRVTVIKGRNVETLMDTLKHRMRQMLAKRAGHFPEVIAETGLSREIISKIHNGTANNPTLETAIRVAEACGYTIQFKLKESAMVKNSPEYRTRNRKPERAAARRKKM